MRHENLKARGQVGLYTLIQTYIYTYIHHHGNKFETYVYIYTHSDPIKSAPPSPSHGNVWSLPIPNDSSHRATYIYVHIYIHSHIQIPIKSAPPSPSHGNVLNLPIPKDSTHRATLVARIQEEKQVKALEIWACICTHIYIFIFTHTYIYIN